MVIKTQGLVLKQRNIGEKDKFITILSKDQGVIEASARGVKSVKSKILSGTQPLCFSEFTLFQGKSSYVINDAQVIESFYDIRLDIEKTALASYFCELLSFISPGEDNGEDYLRLALNTLSYLCTSARTPAFLKPVFEWKLMAISGFCPDLSECASCGNDCEEQAVFYPAEGLLRCRACAEESSQKNCFPLNKPILAALRFMTEADLKKLFLFKLEPKALEYLGTITEYYTLYHCGRGFHSLDFYKNLPKL